MRILRQSRQIRLQNLAACSNYCQTRSYFYQDTEDSGLGHGANTYPLIRGLPFDARCSLSWITISMTFRGLPKAITSLLIACGIGGTGYGTHKYIAYKAIPTTSVATYSHHATSAIAIPQSTAVPELNASTTIVKASESPVLIEVGNSPSAPPNTAFRKQSFGGPLSISSTILGSIPLFLSPNGSMGATGWVFCGLSLLATLYLVFRGQNVRLLYDGLISQYLTAMDTQTEPDERNVQIESLNFDLGSAHSVIAAIHQVVDPNYTYPETRVLDLVRDLVRSQTLNDERQEMTPRTQRDIVGEQTNLEQVKNRMRRLEESNLSLKDDLKRSKDDLERSEDGISRLIEQNEVDSANYKRKKEHYKAVAHFIVSTNDATKVTEQTSEDSLQSRLREIMAEHNERLSKTQQDNESLRTELTIAKNHKEVMSQKLARFDQETIQQNMAIESEVKRLRENENAQLLRTQKLEDASAERERYLRDQLEKIRDDGAMEVKGCETVIRSLRGEIKSLEEEKNVALGDLQDHRQNFDRNLQEATQKMRAQVTTTKTEKKAVQNSIFASQQKEITLTRANLELEGRLQQLELGLAKKLDEKEVQAQRDKQKYDHLVAFVRSKMRKPDQDDTSKRLADEGIEIKERSLAGQLTSQSARPQNISIGDQSSHAHNTVVGLVEPEGSNAVKAEHESQPNGIQSSNDREKKVQPVPDSEPDIDHTHRLENLSPIYASSTSNHAPHSPRVQASHLEEELQVKPEAQAAHPKRKSGSQIPTVQRKSAIPTSTKRASTLRSPNIPGLHPTTDSAHHLPPLGSTNPTEPPPILLSFNPVEFTASAPTAPRPLTPTKRPPHPTDAPQITSTTETEPSYPQGRRNTEAEIGARPKLQPRRRNQTITASSKAAPRSRSTSSPFQFDPQAPSAAMTPPPAVPTLPDALALYDKANALAKVSLE